MASLPGKVSIINSRLHRNQASSFGGAGKNGRWINCVLSGNTAYGGGGVFLESSDAVIGCTIAHNAAIIGGGVYCGANDAQVRSSIIWGNVDVEPDAATDQIAGELCESQPVVSYSCVQGWSTLPRCGAGMIDLDPLFIDPAGSDNLIGTEDDNYRLHLGSPCVNAGEPWPGDGYAIDIDGQARVQWCRMDMGASESGYLVLTDCNGNGENDACEVQAGEVVDADRDGVPDVCQHLNETCASAAWIELVEGTAIVEFSTHQAATEGPVDVGGVGGCGVGGGGDGQIVHDVWFKFVSTCSGKMTISACDVDFDAKLAVYESCPGVDGVAIACADDVCGQGPRVSIVAETGKAYRVCVGGSALNPGEAMGQGALVIACEQTPTFCVGDLSGDMQVNAEDLLILVNTWGACVGEPAECAGDVDGDGVVNISDLLVVLEWWGQCP